MTLYIKSGSRYTFSNDEDYSISKQLPPNNYTVLHDAKTGFYIETIDKLAINSPKIYGDVQSKVDRVINTFYDRPGNTGVLLTGEKGSGKTLLAKLLSQTLLEKGCSTLLVNQKYKGEDFNNFLQMIKEPCMVLFDEFEKTYSQYQDQFELLTLLDGAYSSKKLFILTCNQEKNLSEYLINRPGRIYYRFEYNGLEEDFIREYCEDVLQNKNHMEDLITFTKSFKECNFDILKALVEEMNRYDETVSQVVKLLNAAPTKDTAKFLVVELKNSKGETLTNHDKYVNGGSTFNIFLSHHGISCNVDYDEDDEDDDRTNPWFTANDIYKIEGTKYYLRNNFFHAILEKETSKRIEWSSLW